MSTATKPQKFNPADPQAAPASAFNFEASAVNFAASGEEKQTSKPVELLARTGEPVDHWYWGRIVHDFAGMKSKPVIAFDWCHDPDELIGRGDRVDTSSGDLVISGSVESLEVGDQADKIIKLSDRGVPFEASIQFDPYSMVLEYVPGDLEVEVNGRTQTGPLVIAREWQLRRVAICPSGYDAGTAARFSEADQAASFSVNLKGPNMATNQTKPADTKPADVNPDATKLSADTKPAETKPAETAGSKATKFDASQLDRFVDKFGAEDGVAYLRGGFSYEAALEKHVEKLEAAQQAADKARKDAESKLGAVNLGELEAVATGKPDASGGEQGPGNFASNFAAAMGKGKSARK